MSSSVSRCALCFLAFVSVTQTVRAFDVRILGDLFCFGFAERRLRVDCEVASLFAAIKAGDYETVRACVKRAPDSVRERTKGGLPHQVARKYNEHIIAAYLENCWFGGSPF